MENIEGLGSTRAASLLALFTSSGTLICCAIPALLVAVGAGAALSSLIANIPQLVWFSEHKMPVFLTAAIMLVVAGFMQWRARRLPCPVDPVLAQACTRMRRNSLRIYLFSVGVFGLGVFFAFIAPLIF